MKIQQNVSLAEYTTFKIGGPARYFFTARNKKDIAEAVKFSKDKKLPYFVLGGGSNLLVGDDGFNGVIIKLGSKEIELDGNKIIVGAGASLSSLVNFSIKNNLTGMEWAAGIPGTVGGAIRGNAGAFGYSISEAVKSVKTLFGEFKNVDCRFNYRHSVFKDNQEIILAAEIVLPKGDKKQSQELVNDYLRQRKEKHPLYPSAGSVFKNPKLLIAGRLIERAGLSGKQIGRAMVSQRHANFIVNLGGAKAGDVMELINLIKKSVKKKSDIILEEEIQYLGLK